jgi:hypothetical protein
MGITHVLGALWKRLTRSRWAQPWICTNSVPMHMSMIILGRLQSNMPGDLCSNMASHWPQHGSRLYLANTLAFLRM